MTGKTERLYIRVSPEFKQAIQEYADKDNRSMAEWLLNLAEKEITRLDHLKAHGEPHPITAEQVARMFAAIDESKAMWRKR